MQIYASNATGYDSIIEPSYMTQFQNQSSGKPSKLIEKSIAENGEYSASDDNADGYSKVTVNVSGRSSSSNDVIFYDYDGSIVTSYSATDFANLSAMPANPTHEGLTAQGWNWSLIDAKNYVNKYGKLNIGQMYITSDGKTRLYITLSEGRTSPVLQLYLQANSKVDIDWGDDSVHSHSTFVSTESDYVRERHEYSEPGDYVIAITVVSGGFILQSSLSGVSTVLWNGDGTPNSPDKAYNTAIKKIEIGDGVTSIGGYAFCGCSTLSLITIPDNVTSIGNGAFYQCYILSSVTIPDTATSIGGGAFSQCYLLSLITIPNGVIDIGASAFSPCFSLSSVTISDSVTSIGGNAFMSSSLSSIIIPDSVTSIGRDAFNNCSSLSLVTIPNGVTSIDIQVFANCSSLSSVTIPKGVTSISSYAFRDCRSLSTVIISDNVTTIGSSAFYDCSSLSSITIPNSVISIDSSAFQNCSRMSYIKFESETPPTVVNSNAWDGVSTSTKILVPAGTLETYKTATNYPDPSKYTYEEY